MRAIEQPSAQQAAEAKPRLYHPNPPILSSLLLSISILTILFASDLRLLRREGQHGGKGGARVEEAQEVWWGRRRRGGGGGRRRRRRRVPGQHSREDQGREGRGQGDEAGSQGGAEAKGQEASGKVKDPQRQGEEDGEERGDGKKGRQGQGRRLAYEEEEEDDEEVGGRAQTPKEETFNGRTLAFFFAFLLLLHARLASLSLSLGWMDSKKAERLFSFERAAGARCVHAPIACSFPPFLCAHLPSRQSGFRIQGSASLQRRQRWRRRRACGGVEAGVRHCLFSVCPRRFTS